MNKQGVDFEEVFDKFGPAESRRGRRPRRGRVGDGLPRVVSGPGRRGQGL